MDAARLQALFASQCVPCGLWKPLHASGSSWRIHGEGSPDARIVLVGEGPARDESTKGRVFVGRAGRLLDRALRLVKLPRQEIWITNVARCWPRTDSGSTRKPKTDELEYCRPYLDQELARLARKRVIVALGETATKQLLGPKALQGGITENQGRVLWSEAFQCWVVITVHPAFALRKPNELFWVITDLIRAQRVLEHGGPQTPRQAAYTVVRSLDQLAEARTQLLRSEYIVFDTETNGLHPTKSRAHIYSLCGREPGQSLDQLRAWVIPRYLQGMTPAWGPSGIRVVDATLREILLSEIPKGGTHLAFDIQMSLSTIGVWPRAIRHDMGIAHHLFNNHLPPRAHGLKVMSDLYTSLGRYDDPLDRWLIEHGHVQKGGRADRGAVWLAPDEIVHPYAAADVVVPHHLTPLFEEKLRRERLWDVYQDERIPLLQEYAGMDREGIRIDEPKLDAMSVDVSEILGRIETAVTEIVEHPINLNSSQQLARYLFSERDLPVFDRTATGAPSTAEHVLKEMTSLDPVPALVLQYRTFQKLKGTYISGNDEEVKGLKSAVDPDGFARPSTRLTVVETLRLATGGAIAPHLMPLPIPVWHCPAHGRYNLKECCPFSIRSVLAIRSLYIPDDPEQYCLVSADFRQQEFILMCLAAKETKMEEAILDGGEDAHLYTMRQVFKRTRDEFFFPNGDARSESLAAEFKRLRRNSKNSNFASLFLVQPKKLAKMNEVSIEEATHQLERFYEELPNVRLFQQETIAELRRTGRVIGLFQAYRIIPGIYSDDFWDQAEAERQGVNFVIQNAGAHVMIRGFLRLAKFWRGGRGPWQRADFPARVKWTVHDEVVALVRRDLVEQAKVDMTRFLAAPHRELIGGCGIPRGLPVDVKALEAWE